MEVRVWVGVIIIKNDKVLLLKRINSHWDSTWCFPGWHLEFWESWEDCAKRETKEETNLEIKNIEFAWVTNDFFEKENKHYNTIFMTWEYSSGELKNLEPHKCKSLDWFDFDNLPKPLFLPIENLLQQDKNILKKIAEK